MSNAKNTVVNQHYISQGLIRLFSENKRSVFEFNADNEKVYRVAISRTMYGKKIYEHSGLPENALEQFFKKIEDKYIPTIKSVIDLLDNGCIEDTRRVIRSIVKFYLLFYYRSGAILYELGYQNHLIQEEIVNKMLDRISNYSYIERLSKAIINDYKMVLVKTNENGFLLSDQYISTASLDCKGKIANYSNRTIGFVNCLIMLPISSKYYVLFYNGSLTLDAFLSEKDLVEISKDDLFLLNKAILRNSYKKCIAMHEQDFKNLTSFKSDSDGTTGVLVRYSNGLFSEYSLKKEVFLYDTDLDVFYKYPQYISELQQFKESHHRDISRNDLCLCGSGKKYKKCCIEKYQKSQLIFHRFKLEDSSWMCTPSECVEYPIHSFWGQKEGLSSISKEVLSKAF